MLALGALIIGAAALSATAFTELPVAPWGRWLFVAALALAVAFQTALIWRYTPLAPKEVQGSRGEDPGALVSIVISNVLQASRDADVLFDVLRSVDPDIVLCVETDEWWRERLDAFKATHRLQHLPRARPGVPLPARPHLPLRELPSRPDAPPRLGWLGPLPGIRRTESGSFGRARAGGAGGGRR